MLRVPTYPAIANTTRKKGMVKMERQKGGGGLEINYLIIFVLAIIIFVILSFMIKFYVAHCDTRQSFLSYLASLNFSNPCGIAIATDNGQQFVSDYLDSSSRTGGQRDRLGTLGRAALRRREVYNIGDQIYTYEQAQKKCAAYNADLASYDQIVDAYNNGAEWCAYGWSQGQNAYFPMQRMRNGCGRVGVNGGRFPQNLKLGANCFGIKPAGMMPQTPLIPEQPSPPRRPSPPPFCDRRKNFNACNRLTDDLIKPFNNSRWSEWQN